MSEKLKTTMFMVQSNCSISLRGCFSARVDRGITEDTEAARSGVCSTELELSDIYSCVSSSLTTGNWTRWDGWLLVCISWGCWVVHCRPLPGIWFCRGHTGGVPEHIIDVTSRNPPTPNWTWQECGNVCASTVPVCHSWEDRWSRARKLSPTFNLRNLTCLSRCCFILPCWLKTCPARSGFASNNFVLTSRCSLEGVTLDVACGVLLYTSRMFGSLWCMERSGSEADGSMAYLRVWTNRSAKPLEDRW